MQAAPGDLSSASARFLGGTLLFDGVDLDSIAALEGAAAAHDGSLPAPDTDPASLDLTTLGVVNVQIPGGLSVPLDDFLELGLVNQYAQASDEGVSRAAVGAVSDAGIVDTTGSGEYPADASFDLTGLLGPEVTETVGSLELGLGAISSEAELDAAGPTVTRDYNIAGAELVLGLPPVASVTDLLVGAGGVADEVDSAIATLVGPSGLLAQALASLNAALAPLVGDDALTVSITSDIEGALDDVLDTPLGDGVITIDLRSGTVTVDLDALLVDTTGHGLNSLDPGEEILSASVLGNLVTRIGLLLNTVPAAVESALTDALEAATLTISADVCLVGSEPDCTTPVVDIGTGIQVSMVDQTLADVVDGTATASITLKVAGLPVTVPLGTLLSALATPITEVLFDDETGVVATLIPTLTTAITGILDELDPVVDLLNGVVSLRGNVQEDAPDGSYSETALVLAIGDLFGEGGVGTLEIARATVGPNSLLADPVPPVATSIDPDRGPETGGTEVTITGTGFTGATGVTFDGVPGTSFTVVDDETIIVTSPAHAPGTVDVVVEHPDGDADPLDFEYYAVTRVDEVDPGSGPEAGGTEVTITGQCFTGATEVLFGSTPAASFTVVSDTEITATTPAGTGLVDVTVVGAGDCGDGTLEDGFAFVAPDAPTVTGIVPDRGPETGGTSVTITGTGFTGATGVTFDGVPGTSFTVVDDETITVTSPAHAPTTVNVVVQHPDGDAAPVDFEYYPVTRIDDVDPGTGPEAGGTEVTVTGQCFTGATEVLFGTTSAASFTVVSDTEITAVAPPGVGTVDVTVVGAGDCGDGSLEDGFEYEPSPVAASLLPTTGPETGGTSVTITGTGFTDATGVTFDGVPGTSFTVVDDETITVVSPAHAPGTVEVVVQHPVLDSDPLDFEYYAVTRVDEVDPDSGPEAGGAEVTITGQCFTGATEVLFGSTPAASFTVVSDTEITAVAPAGTGVVDVTVVGAGDCGDGTLEDGFEYEPSPVATSIDPDRGPETGGTTVEITGTGFTGATGVTFDGVPGTSFTVVDDETITVVSPAGTPGTAEVVVQHPVLDSEPLDFEYYAVTRVDDVDPGSGPEAGGAEVTITGQCFTGATEVLFGSTPAASFTVVSDSEITAVAPAGTGVVDVTVVGTGDCGEGTIDDGFSYIAPTAPTITDLDPDRGPETGGTTVTITGTGFPGATAVTFDGVLATSVTIVDATTITAVSPAHAPAIVDVVVEHPSGNAAPADFEYYAVEDGGGIAVTGSSPVWGLLAASALLLGGTGLLVAQGTRRDA